MSSTQERKGHVIALLSDGREHSGSDPNDLNGGNIAAMFVVSALDKFRLDPCGDGADLSLPLPGCPRSGKRSTQSNQGQRATAIKGKMGKRRCLTLA